MNFNWVYFVYRALRRSVWRLCASVCLILIHPLALGFENQISLNSGFFGISGMSFVNPNYETEKDRNIPLYSGQIKQLSESDNLSFGLDIEGQFSPEARTLNAFTVSELYLYGNPDWSENTLIFGRKLQGWSQLDHHLGLGLIEPNYRVDPLRMHSQGLTGLFFQVQKPLFSVQIFASSFYLPNQGPSLEVRQGQFVKGHPWVNLPPEQVVILGETTPINYAIEQPDYADIVLQNSYGFAVSTAKKDVSGFSGGAFYFNKPMNQLALGYKGKLNLASSNPTLDVDLKPQVLRHSIRGIELHHESEQSKSYLTLIEDAPEDSDFTSEWTYQQFQLAQFVGLGSQWQNRMLQFGAHYVERLQGEAIEKGPEAQAGTAVLQQPYFFKQLLSIDIGLRWKFPRRSQNKASLRWDQELKSATEIFMLQVEHEIEKNWLVMLGFDVLRNKGRRVGQTANIYSSATANDRFFGGINYVF